MVGNSATVYENRVEVDFPTSSHEPHTECTISLYNHKVIVPQQKRLFPDGNYRMNKKLLITETHQQCLMSLSSSA